MRSFITMIVAAFVMASTTAQATTQTSSCLTVTAVVNSEFGNAVIVALSPAIPGCSPNSTAGVEFAVSAGQVSAVTVSNLNSYLASGLAALVGGRQVQVVYDDSTSNCYAISIANGGFWGQCP
jgi:hypothetical protein